MGCLARSTEIGIIGIALCLLGSGCKDATQVSSAMMPTIRPGERVRVDYSAYAVGTPKRWDVVAFEPPMFTNQLWVMRVVGLPGESVLITNDTLSINGVSSDIPRHMTNVTYVGMGGFGVGAPFKIPKDSYFVLGDNSKNANDSRYWGALHGSNIIGRVRRK